MVDHQRLAGVLVAFARNLVGDYDIDVMLDALCREVAAALPVTAAGVMIADEGGNLRFVAASDDLVREIESLQIELGEGPCLHAYMTGEQVVEEDLEVGSRFPRFAPRAVKAGLRGVYSFPMRLHDGDQHVGALNFYTAGPGDFGDEDREAGQILADVATSYILNARAFEHSVRLTGQLQHALDTRVVVEQAKGKLSEQLATSPSEAFERMRQHARRNRRKLHDIAREILDGRLRLGEP
ncbi:MAG TPA: GAF and ANTAR domain-containing protein [Egibacteraceae bacterium]|nr:GAF and ANTAR domain-containing protein [Egibacteraceae bacterium]